MNVNPYVQFGGSCAQAFDYYKQHLGASEVMLMTFRGSPAEEGTPEEWRDKVMHGSLRIGQSMLMGTDGMSGQPYHGMQGCSLTLSVDTTDEAERVFAALADAGQVTMPMTQTFFAQRFGMATDRFGIAWMVICQPR